MLFLDHFPEVGIITYFFAGLTITRKSECYKIILTTLPARKKFVVVGALVRGCVLARVLAQAPDRLSLNSNEVKEQKVNSNAAIHLPWHIRVFTVDALSRRPIRRRLVYGETPRAGAN